MVEAINLAQKPIILCGGGTISSGASQLIKELAEKAQIPIVCTLMGIGALPSRHPLHLGMLGMHGTFAANKAVHQADLLISMGVRFSDRVMGNLKAFSPNSFKVHIDIDAAELNKNVIVDLPVTGDIQAVISQLLKQLNKGESEQWVYETSLVATGINDSYGLPVTSKNSNLEQWLFRDGATMARDVLSPSILICSANFTRLCHVCSVLWSYRSPCTNHSGSKRNHWNRFVHTWTCYHGI